MLRWLAAVAIFVGDEWHKRGRPGLLHRAADESGSFEPLISSAASDVASSVHSALQDLESWNTAISSGPGTFAN
jgi:hypothetical protein